MAAFSGVVAVSAFDQESGSPTGQPGSITPSVDGEVIMTIGIINAGTINTIDSGFTILDIIPAGGGTAYGLSHAYLIQSAATPVNPTWSNVTPRVSVMASFKPAPTGPTGPTDFVGGSVDNPGVAYYAF